RIGEFAVAVDGARPFDVVERLATGDGADRVKYIIEGGRLPDDAGSASSARPAHCARTICDAVAHDTPTIGHEGTHVLSDSGAIAEGEIEHDDVGWRSACRRSPREI